MSDKTINNDFGTNAAMTNSAGKQVGQTGDHDMIHFNYTSDEFNNACERAARACSDPQQSIALWHNLLVVRARMLGLDVDSDALFSRLVQAIK